MRKLPLKKIGHYAFLTMNGILLLGAAAFAAWHAVIVSGTKIEKPAVTPEDFDKSLSWLEEKKGE